MARRCKDCEDYCIVKMKKWSRSWKGSKKPRKQRKFRYNAPLHVKQKFLNVHLSKELRKKHGRRAVRVREGYKVIIVRGNFRKTAGKVTSVELKKSKIFVEKVEIVKKDGNKVQIPIQPSNVVITELNLSDKERVKAIERGKVAGSEKIVKAEKKQANKKEKKSK